jgi:predicted ester cyclase
MFDRFSGQPKTRQDLQEYITDEGLMEHIAFFESGFPNYQLHIQDAIEENDMVAARILFIGTNSGDFAGMPATGRSVEMPFIAMYRFADEKVVENWISADQLALRQQLEGEPAMA